MRRNLARVIVVVSSTLVTLAGCDSGNVERQPLPTSTPTQTHTAGPTTAVPTSTVPPPTATSVPTEVPATFTRTSTPTETPVTPVATATPVDTDTPEATATSTNTPPPTFTPTVTPTGVQVNVGRTVADSGDTAVVEISLVSGGANVGGVQNDLLFDNTVINLEQVSRCRITPAISDSDPGCENDPPTGACKTLSRSLVVCGGNPTPPGCPADAGSNISRFRAIIAATAVPNNNLIPDGVLYTCEFTVSDRDALPAVISNSNIVASRPGGGRIDEVGGADGVITLGARVAVSASAGATDLVIEAADAEGFPGSGIADIGGQLVGFSRTSNVLLLDDPLAQDVPAGELVLIATPEPTPTPTVTETLTRVPTSTPTFAPSSTPVDTATAVPTATEEPPLTPTEEPTLAPTEEPTLAPTEEPTATATVEATAEATATVPEATATAEATAEATATAPEATATAEATATEPEATATAEATATPTAEATASETATEAPTATATATMTEEPATPTPTETPA